MNKLQKYSEEISAARTALQFLKQARHFVSNDKARDAIDRKIILAEETLDSCKAKLAKLADKMK